MEDREREKKKKRAYLADFEKDLNGNYQYRGAHYRYAGEHPHSRVLALLWLFCGGGAALTVGAGALPGATAHAPVYLLLPYMAALLLALYAVVLLVRLTRGGARVRAYIHEQTAQNCPLCAGRQRYSALLPLRGRGWLCLQRTHSCFGECKAFLYFLNCSPAPLLPLLRGSSSGCRGKKKNNYTLS